MRHVDTDILRGMLDTTEDDDLWRVGRHVANQIRKSNPIGVSMLAIGEAFHTLSEDSRLDNDETCGAAATKLREMVKSGKLVLVGIGGSEDAFSIALRLMKEDWKVTPVDAMILSIACNCDSCRELYTTDNTLLTSIKARDVAKEFGVKVKPPLAF